jgi:ribosomal protein L37E
MARQDPTEGDYMADGSDDQGWDKDTILICDECGGEAYGVPPDYVDYCDECGVVEGSTHKKKVT